MTSIWLGRGGNTRSAPTSRHGVALVAAVVVVAGAVGLAPAAGGAQSASVVVNPRSAADGVLGSFSALGAGIDDTVLSVTVVDDTVYAGGSFTAASGVAHTRNIAAWSSVDDTWHALGTGTNGEVVGLAVVDDTLYAGGKFLDASGVPGTAKVAAWSTADDTWSALGIGMDRDVFALAADDDTLYSGGFFTSASGVAGTNYIATWSTVDDTWSALGTGVTQDVYALAVDDDTVYTGGYFFDNLMPAGFNRIAAWSTATSTWSKLGTGMSSNVYALAMNDDTLYAGGYFISASGVAGTNYIAAWRDDTWHALGTGVNGTTDSIGFGVRALAVDDMRGLVYAGGHFTATNSGATNSMNRVGVWDSAISEWIPLTFAGGNGVSAAVISVAVDDSVVYLGGVFTNAGGVAAADRIARWSWQAPQGSNTLDTTVGASVTLTGEGFIGVPATGGVKVGSTVATYTRDDSATITMTVPAGSFTNAPIQVNGVGGWGQVGVLSVPGPPAPPVPAGPPTAVGAVAGDASATVAWSAPTSTGSFPVTSYQVMSSPSARTCLTSALTCEVSGLVNGTDYTFSVRALTGVGWGSWSMPSGVVTPEAAERRSILITGSRADVRGKPGVVVEGSSKGLTVGATLFAWVRFDRQVSYRKSLGRILVDRSGEFTWQRRAMRTIHLQVRSPTGDLASNTLSIRVR